MPYFFFFNDTATTEIYTLSLHDALPISSARCHRQCRPPETDSAGQRPTASGAGASCRSEEHTSELQSRQYLVCRLLLEKKKKTQCKRRPRIRRTRSAARRPLCHGRDRIH